MLRKGAKVEWTAEAERGVRECIKALAKTPVLGYPDFRKEFRVATDASSYALGAVLSQEGISGDQPVAYASRRLTPAESRYSTIERELLGVVWAVENFRPYLYGRRFVIITDHKPLQWTGTLKETSARVSRWKERLMPYQYQIQHTPGKNNIVADWLSRALEAYAIEDEPGPSTSLRDFFREWQPEEQEGADADTSTEVDRSLEEHEGIRETEDVINGKSRQIRWKSKTTGLTSVEFRKEGRRTVMQVESPPGITKDQIVRVLAGLVKKGKTYHLHVGNATIWRKIQDLQKEGRIATTYTLVRCLSIATTVLDAARQMELAIDYHTGKTNHRGVQEMVAALRRRYFWDNMKTTAEQVVKECRTCCRVKALTRPPVEIQTPTPTADQPLKRLEMDTFTWRGHTWLTTIDTFSKLAWADKVDRRPSEAVVAALQRWCGCYGVPEAITSDGGTEFKNAMVEAEAKRLEIAWHFTTPGHTQGRGCVERLHGTLSDHLRILMAEQEVDIPEAMRKAMLAYNHSVHSVTGYSPIEVVFGTAFRRRDAEQTAPVGELTQAIVLHRKAQGKVWRSVRDRIAEEKARRVLRHNVQTTDVAAKVTLGTVVYRKLSTNRRKELERYAGPYRVVGILDHNRFTLEDVENPGRRRQVHITQLKIPATAPPEVS